MEPEELSAGFTHASQRADHLAVLAVEEPDMVVREVGDEQVLLRLVRRERDAAGGATDAGVFRQLELFLEVPLFVRDVDAVRIAIRGVDQTVVREVERQVACELLRLRAVRFVGVVFILRADVRQLVTVGAPPAFELQRGQVEHHHAAGEIVVGDVHLVGSLVDADHLGQEPADRIDGQQQREDLAVNNRFGLPTPLDHKMPGFIAVELGNRAEEV